MILAGRVSRSLDAWNARVALAERLNARVVTDLKIGAAFPTDHPLHAGAPGDISRRRRRAAGDRAPPTSSSASTGSTRRHASRRAGGNVAAKVDAGLASITACTTAGAWTIRACRRSIVLLACRARCRGAGTARSARPRRSTRACAEPRAEFRKLADRQAHASIISPTRCAARSASGRPRSRICRCRGTAPVGRSAIRSTISAPTAAAASAAAPAFRSARRSRSRAPAGCRSRSAATATS